MEYIMENFQTRNKSKTEDFPKETSPVDIKLLELVIVTLRKTIASLHESDPDSIMQYVQRIISSEKVLKLLPKSFQKNYDGIFEILTHETSVSSGTPIDLFNLPVVTLYNEQVKAELKEIQAYINKLGGMFDPHAQWADLVEIVQRNFTKNKANELVVALDKNANLEDLMKKFKEIEPPTAKKSVSRKDRIKTADQLITDLNIANAGKSALRFSSGLPTLDRGYTNQYETMGFISPGQFIVVMGPTGTGKTSFTNTVTPSFGIDLKNWGLKDALQVLWHTEEESIDKLKGFRMDQKMKYHHLANNLIIDAIGTSRKRMAETLYDLVIDADEKARKLHRPITDFLPYICQLDYLQSIAEPGEDEKTATARTAEFLLRGVCAWDPEEMNKFSGVDFRTYAGMAWPKGMEHHRIAVVAYAQLVKVDDESLYYKSGKRNIQVSDFAILDEKDQPLWDLREGDLRLFGKNQMRGSGIIAQNAHAIVILHRSVPYNNPSKKDDKGKSHLSDTRARILFDKARTGSTMAYAPMRFDVQSTQLRAQYYDELAERAIQAGILKNFDPTYQESGDPILPIRESVNPLEEYRY